MEKNIGVGLLIGLVLATSTYVWNSNEFSKEQKTLLLILIIFPPAQWVLILVLLAYNYLSMNNSSNYIKDEKKIDSNILSLSELKEKGILTKEEFDSKIEKINAEKSELNLKNSTEYKQLKSLYDSGVLTKDEFENKILFLSKSFVSNSIKSDVTVNETNDSFEDNNQSKNEKLFIRVSLIILFILLICIIIVFNL